MPCSSRWSVLRSSSDRQSRISTNRPWHQLLATAAEITAVLDWELAHLGDYHEYLAWTLQEGYGYRDAEDRFIVCGLIEREAFLERYSKATGFPVDPKKIAYYSVMNTWKSVIIVLGTGIRCVMGGKSHQDIPLTWLAGFGHVCVDSLTQLLERSEHGS